MKETPRQREQRLQAARLDMHDVGFDVAALAEELSKRLGWTEGVARLRALAEKAHRAGKQCHE